MSTIVAQICIRRDTAANFTSANPTLALGEIAYETDTRNIKVGDGATAWTALGYINPYRGGTAAAPTSNTVLGSSAGTGLASGAVMNVVIGADAGKGIVNSDFNVAIGGQALRGFDASLNTAVGYNAMGTFASGNTGALNTAVGYNAGASIRGGGQNVAVGSDAGSTNQNASNTVTVGYQAATLNTANDITAVGANALDANTTGANNTAVGKDALGANTTGAGNVAIGNLAGSALTTGSNNVAIGLESLSSGGSTVYSSVGVGYRALWQNTGGGNVAIGSNAQAASAATTNVVAIGNAAALLNQANEITAVGGGALDANTTGGSNTAVGKDALGANTTGGNNVAIGNSAGQSATVNNQNTFVGSLAGNNITSDSGILIGAFAGTNALTSAVESIVLGRDSARLTAAGATLNTITNSIFIGSSARANANSESNQIVIGYQAVGNGSNTTTIGNSSTTQAWMAGRVIPGRAPGFGTGFGTSGFYIASTGADNGGVVGNFVGIDTNSFAVRSNNGATDRLVVASNGNVTVSNGNLIVGTAGTGIDFSATANSSGTMTSELLSDYEEGTWTPTFSPASGAFTTLTMDVQSATYTKIGRQVTVRGYIRTDNVTVGTASGQLSISGLPFTVAGSGFSAGSVSYAVNWAAAPESVYANAASTSLFMTNLVSLGGGTTFTQVTALTTGATADRNELVFSCTYFV